MKNTNKKTIDEKIAYLEALKEVLRYLENMRDCYADINEEGNATTPKDDYNKRHYIAYVELIEKLNEEI